MMMHREVEVSLEGKIVCSKKCQNRRQTSEKSLLWGRIHRRLPKSNRSTLLSYDIESAPFMLFSYSRHQQSSTSYFLGFSFKW